MEARRKIPALVENPIPTVQSVVITLLTALLWLIPLNVVGTRYRFI
jgi:hypothetical protein